MIKYDVLGVDYSATTYDELTQKLVSHAQRKESIGVTALAVHGLIECVNNTTLRDKVNTIQYIVPDGQPIRWFMNHFHKAGLNDRVYGPELTWRLLKAADKAKLGVYFYGSTKETLDKFIENVERHYPNVMISGFHIDRFRDASAEEDIADVEKISASGASIVLVGRGCPRQEQWVADHIGKVPAVMLAVGAAFDFHAGLKKQAPPIMQRNGLEWLFRLTQEPKRLWRRYLFTNSKYVYLVTRKLLGITK